ncbi:MAG: phenylacetate--CoA ligase family protein [Pseudomonadota bacterium]
MAQARMLAALCAHAWASVPAQQDRLRCLGWTPGVPLLPALWSALPPMTRRDLQDERTRWLSNAPPPAHGACVDVETSGSTATPVTITGTLHDALLGKAFELRLHLWHDIDFLQTLAYVRKSKAAAWAGQAGLVHERWGDLATFPFQTGPSYGFDVNRAIEDQLRWLRQVAPAYLMTYPSSLDALVRLIGTGAPAPDSLAKIFTTGEALSADTVEQVRQVLGIPVIDVYSAHEVGAIALQCPECALYHIQSERVLVEVVDEAGRPCREGEIGRVLVTPLHNYAQPLLRYEIGDLAEVGPERCSCGRGLPTLRRILGRVRNTLVAPDGRRYWPSFGIREIARVAPVRQGQFVQTAPDAIEARLVAERALSQAETAAVTEAIERRLPMGFRITLSLVEHIPRGAGGKFEEFYTAFATT